MLKVAVLSPAAELGGAERSLYTFLKAAPKDRIEATVFLPRVGPFCDHLSGLQVSWQVVPQPKSLISLSRRLSPEAFSSVLPVLYQGPLYLHKLRAGIKAISPDLIYSNGIKGHILASMLRRSLRIKTVWHVRDISKGPLLGFLGNLAADRIIANSHATAATLQKSMKAACKLSVVHNAVDTGEFTPDGPVADVGGSGSSGFRIALPGAFARWKGHELFLLAALRVREEFPQAHFYFIGGWIYDTMHDAGYEKGLHDKIRFYGLVDSVTFTGFQTQMPPWYRAMDLIVNASVEPEPFGRTLLEAMACGRAVIGPDAGGIPEFVENGSNGILYKMGDSVQLADAIISLLRNPDMRRRMGMAGRETAVTRFGAVAHAAEIIEILHSTFSSSR